MSTLASDLQSNRTVLAGQTFSRDSSFGALTLAIVQELQATSATSFSFDQMLAKVAQIALAKTNCADIWICRKGENGDFTNATSLADSSNELESLLSNQLVELCRLTQTSNGPQISPLDFGAPRILMAVPISVRHNLNDPIELILAGAFDTQSQGSRTTDPVWFMIAAGNAISQWVQSRTWARSDADKKQIIEINKFCLQLAQSGDIGSASRVLVNSVRRLTGAQHVSLSIDGCLVAISDLEQFDPQTESNQVVRAACCASLKAGSPVAYQISAGAPAATQLFLQSFCRSHNFEACVSIPLGNPDQLAIATGQANLASLLIAGSAQQLGQAEQLKSVEQIVMSISDHFNLSLQAHRTVGKIAKDRIGKWTRHRWRKLILYTCLGFCGLMAIPMPYRIHCDCEIQPVSRRYIVAPFEGILERSLVETGDVVEKGQILARLDGRLLRIELAGLNAELAGARKRFDSELAAGNIAQSQIAKSEMERLKAKISLLNERTETLEIRSPIAGVVVSGDLEKAEGASLTIGQALFEIAPLDQMIVEISIPEAEIPYAKSGMNVAVKLNAFPYETWHGNIETIHPSAEIIDNDSFFVAQVSLSNENGSLRPGMKGNTKIKSNWACLGWSLFHRPWETVRYWSIW